MNREIIPGRKIGFSSVLYKLTIADTLISSVKVLAALAWAETNRLGWPLAGAEHSTSQG